MKIWLITIGEPVFHPENKLRMHRTGILSKLISQRRKDIDVVWWTSTFNHFTKKHDFEKTTKIQIDSNLTMIPIKGSGYPRNVSLKRIKDHKIIDKTFKVMLIDEEKPDLIVASFPTIGLCETAVHYANSNNIPILIDYRDLWPEVYIDLIPSPFKFVGKLLLYPLTKRVENIFSKATGLIGVTDSFLKIALNKARREKNIYDAVFPLGYLKNQFNEDDIIQAQNYWNKILSKQAKLRICFFGAIGYQSDWNTIINCIKMASEENLSIEFVICGSGDKLNSLVGQTKNLNNVIFPGFISAGRINVLMQISDFGLCAFLPKENYLNAIPGKAIEYMSGNLPILNSLENSDLGELIRTQNIGFNYDSDKSLLKILKFSIENKNQIKSMKSKIKDVYYNNFDSDFVYTNYIKHIEKSINLFNKI